jgi:hypothetical protein
MIVRSVTGAILALALAASPALACKGDTEIYSDDFATGDGPWDNADWIKIGGGKLEVKVQPDRWGVARFRGDLPKEFDVCVDVTFPAVKDPTLTSGGIAFWFKDYENTYAVLLAPDGQLGVPRFNKGRVLIASPWKQEAALKPGAGSKNTIRVTAKGNSVTVYVNDQKVRTFRGVPDEAYIGLAGGSEKEQENTWTFSNFKLTDPPK